MYYPLIILKLQKLSHLNSPKYLIFDLCGVFYDKPPALDDVTSTMIIKDNLDYLHKARQAFIASESSEKIRHALRYNVHASGDTKYFTGDRVYYKRLSSKSWRGPAVVLGQDGQ